MYGGVDGETADQMAAALHVDLESDDYLELAEDYLAGHQSGQRAGGT